MSVGPVIYYAHAGAAAQLADCGGRPVIPISTAAELHALRDVADVHGGRLLEANGISTATTTYSRAGVVVSIGAGVKSIGQLYAHLTGRQSRHFKDASEFGSFDQIAVVVTLTSNLDEALMTRLYGDSKLSTAPGLITSATPDHLARSAKRYAAALMLKGFQSGDRVFLYSSKDFQTMHRAEGLFLSGAAPAEEVTQGLASGAALLFVDAESSGFNIAISETKFICPLPRSERAVLELSPLCAHMDRCTSFPALPKIDEAWETGQLVGPSDVRAQALVLFSCSVLRLPDGILSAESNLGAAISTSATVGACITTWREERDYPNGAALNGMINAVSEGRAVGCAVADFNGSDHAAWLGINLCLLGDPEYSIRPLSDLPPIPGPATPPAPKSHSFSAPMSGSSTMLAQLAIKRAILRDAPSRLPMREGVDDIASIFEALDRLEHAVLTGANGDAVEGLQRAANDCFLNFVEKWPWVEEMVQPFTISGARNETVPCFNCGRPGRSYRFRFLHDSLDDLFVSPRCVSCSAQRMTPINCEPRILFTSLKDGQICLLEGVAGMQAIVSVLSPAFEERICFRWPNGSDGELLPQLSMPAVVPQGQIRINVIALWGGEMGQWTIRARLR